LPVSCRLYRLKLLNANLLRPNAHSLVVIAISPECMALCWPLHKLRVAAAYSLLMLAERCVVDLVPQLPSLHANVLRRMCNTA
jgi:hypothetical protein